LRAAALVVGILLFSPHIWYYDVALLAVALAWLWQEANRGGWLPLEKLLLLLAWFTPLLTFLMMVGLKLSVGPLYLAMTIVVLLRRYYWERTTAGHGQAAAPGPAVKSDRPGRN